MDLFFFFYFSRELIIESFPAIDQLNIPHFSYEQYVHNNLMFLEDGHIIVL